MSFHLPIPSWNTSSSSRDRDEHLVLPSEILADVPALVHDLEGRRLAASLFFVFRVTLGFGAMLRCWAASRRQRFEWLLFGLRALASAAVWPAESGFGLDARLPKTGFLSRRRASGTSIAGNRTLIARAWDTCPMLASVLQAASPSALQARCSGHDRRTREAGGTLPT